MPSIPAPPGYPLQTGWPASVRGAVELIPFSDHGGSQSVIVALTRCTAQAVLLMRKTRWRIGQSSWLTGGLITTIALASAWLNTDLQAPPRFDGAGYAVLAESLTTGRGYREIDRPGAPRHAHFPPAYPIVLAALWRITGRSVAAAHLLSLGCTLAAVIAAWRWFRYMESSRVAAILGLALALNWTWARTASSIQSEPLFMILAQAAILAATRAARGGGVVASLQAGLLLAASMLTRHIGVIVAATVGVHLFLQKRILN
jgi:hypothetical protein